MKHEARQLSPSVCQWSNLSVTKKSSIKVKKVQRRLAKIQLWAWGTTWFMWEEKSENYLVKKDRAIVTMGIKKSMWRRTNAAEDALKCWFYKAETHLFVWNGAICKRSQKKADHQENQNLSTNCQAQMCSWPWHLAWVSLLSLTPSPRICAEHRRMERNNTRLRKRGNHEMKRNNERHGKEKDGIEGCQT